MNYMHFHRNITLLSLCLLTALFGCKSTEKFSGFSYDPAGVTETTTKQITPQHKRSIGIASDGIWISNEFPGARLSDFYKADDTLYQAVIKPEIAPINNSAWYAFKVWARKDTTVWLKLSYEDGRHRYIPKLSSNGKSWKRINSQDYRVNKQKGTAFLKLHLGKQPLWVSAQELRTQAWFDHWADSMAQKSFITQDTVGYSHEHRPIRKLTFNEVPAGQHRGVVIVTGRLHPPEVTGNMACYTFLDEVASDTPLARKFRQHFEVLAYPFANPDGVQNGHWRTNNGGIDLNRDWQHFDQPETRAIRDDVVKQLKDNPLAKVYYGMDFHSTGDNIFYPINRDIKTFPDDFTYHWTDSLLADFQDTHFSIEPFDTSGPIAKNWIYNTFGADAVTYEVDDRADREKLREIAKEAAQLIMQGLLEAMQKQ